MSSFTTADIHKERTALERSEPWLNIIQNKVPLTPEEKKFLERPEARRTTAPAYVLSAATMMVTSRLLRRKVPDMANFTLVATSCMAGLSVFDALKRPFSKPEPIPFLAQSQFPNAQPLRQFVHEQFPDGVIETAVKQFEQQKHRPVEQNQQSATQQPIASFPSSSATRPSAPATYGSVPAPAYPTSSSSSSFPSSPFSSRESSWEDAEPMLDPYADTSAPSPSSYASQQPSMPMGSNVRAAAPSPAASFPSAAPAPFPARGTRQAPVAAPVSPYLDQPMSSDPLWDEALAPVPEQGYIRISDLRAGRVSSSRSSESSDSSGSPYLSRPGLPSRPSRPSSVSPGRVRRNEYGDEIVEDI